MQKENTIKPNHYHYASIEPINVINDWQLNFELGNAIKYIARCNHKGCKKDDLKKAITYIEMELSK